MTIAEELFAAAHATAKAEDKVDAILSEVAPGAWSEYTSDYYDESIEVYGVTPSAAIHDAMKAAGFAIVWQHNHEPPRNGCKCPASRPDEVVS